MFRFDEERDEYVAKLNGVAFVCDEPQDGDAEESSQRGAEGAGSDL